MDESDKYIDEIDETSQQFLTEVDQVPEMETSNSRESLVNATKTGSNSKNKPWASIKWQKELAIGGL